MSCAPFSGPAVPRCHSTWRSTAPPSLTRSIDSLPPERAAEAQSKTAGFQKWKPAVSSTSKSVSRAEHEEVDFLVRRVVVLHRPLPHESETVVDRPGLQDLDSLGTALRDVPAAAQHVSWAPHLHLGGFAGRNDFQCLDGAEVGEGGRSGRAL